MMIGQDMTNRPLAALATLLALAAVSGPRPLLAQADSVVRTPHNLSVSGPSDQRALTETEVCKFCHIPHNAVVPAPLWGHALSKAGSYDVPKVTAKSGAKAPSPQPDGASRLCLSCHDGTVALGELGNGRRIRMRGTGRFQMGTRGFIGTDLSGSHPVSFIVPEADPGSPDGIRDFGQKRLAVIHQDKDVKLDSSGKVQCTTCHDPHSDRNYSAETGVPHFWVKSTVQEVCLTCHELR